MDGPCSDRVGDRIGTVLIRGDPACLVGHGNATVGHGNTLVHPRQYTVHAGLVASYNILSSILQEVFNNTVNNNVNYNYDSLFYPC